MSTRIDAKWFSRPVGFGYIVIDDGAKSGELKPGARPRKSVKGSVGSTTARTKFPQRTMGRKTRKSSR